jgi:uncharacterized damage-inducible protein DinB
MNQSQTLADQLERAFRGGAWHGPSVSEALEDLEAATAATHPIPGAHSIVEIVGHLTTWNDVARRRIGGESILNVPPEQDFPAGDRSSPAAWREALERLDAAHRTLHEVVLELDDGRLGDPVAGSDPTIRGLLLGVIQHSAYHAGQIMMLRKAIAAREGRG